MAETTYANCESCGTPMRIDFDDAGKIEKILAPCKCERPSVEEANAAVERRRAEGVG